MRKSFCYNTRIFASNHIFSKQLKRGCVISPDNGSKVGLKGQKFQKQHALKAQKPQKQHALKIQKPQKQHALKGQKLLAQGIALGIIAISKTPCKGKSFVYCQVFESFCPYRATGLCP